MEKSYKVKIDKDLLRQFFNSTDDVTIEQYNELRKCIFVVFVKHFSSYQSNEDLINYAWLAIFARRSQYNPKFDPYNYIYTIVRNEVGNNLIKLNRNINTNELNNVRSYTISNKDNLPFEIKKFSDVLLGLKDFNFMRISKSDLLHLLLFIRLHEKPKKLELPSFYETKSPELAITYKLLKDVLIGNV